MATTATIDVAYNSSGEVLLNRSVPFDDYADIIEVNVTEFIWGMDNDMYQVISGVFTPLTGTERQTLLDQRQAEKEAREQAIADLEARVAALEAETVSDGLNEVTPEDVDAALDAAFDPTDFQAANDFATLKAAVGDLFVSNKSILRKIAIRVLKLSELANK